MRIAAECVYRMDMAGVKTYTGCMERVVNKAESFVEADAWDRKQQHGMSPQERVRVSRVLQKRVFGSTKDIRACQKTS
jgi:hypothetical protein